MRAGLKRIGGPLAVAAAVALATVFAGYGQLSAAAVYDHSVPAPSAVMQTSPGRIDIWTKRPTSTDPSLTQIAVTDVQMNHYEIDPTVVDPNDHTHFSVGVKQDMPPGRYLVYFKTEGAQDFDRDGGMFAIYVGTTPTAADVNADKRLVLTTVDNGDDGPVTGVERGMIEGGIPAFIIVGGMIWYWQQRRQEKQDFVPLDDRDLGHL